MNVEYEFDEMWVNLSWMLVVESVERFIQRKKGCSHVPRAAEIYIFQEIKLNYFLFSAP